MSKNVFTFDIGMPLKILSRGKAKEIKLLSQKKYRDKLSLFIVEGNKCVLDSLGYFELENLICTGNWISKNHQFVKQYQDRILLAENREILKSISSLSNVPEVIAIFKMPEATLNYRNLKKNKFYLLLDGIQDPGNLGTIIRTCDWFGLYEIYASKDTVDMYNQKVVQSAMGSLSRVRIRYGNIEEIINENHGLPVYGTLLNGLNINDISKPSGGFILMGNEGNGISQLLKDKITCRVTIPPHNQSNHPDSLNVAIATAIILYKFTQ